MFLIPVLIYFILYAPFLGIAPYHDGGKEFRFAYNFYSGQYLSNWLPFHPPFKLILSSFFFYLWGYDSYTYLGLFLGVLGIIILFLLAKKIFDHNVAFWSALFLATSGLYLSNGIFSITDFVAAVLILSAFYCYISDNFLMYGIIASYAFLTKEPALVFPIAVVIVDVVRHKKLRLSLLLPFVTFLGWLYFLHATGHQAWNNQNFSNSSNQGSFYTVFHNLITFQFLNGYAYENWWHLFLFNFNWFFWILAILGIVVLVKKKKISNHKAIFSVIALYFVGYTIAVLSFQTYPITRYILPLMPFVYLFSAVGFVTILSSIRFEYWRLLVVAVAVSIIVMQLFISNDPVSNIFWQKTDFLGQNVYVSRLGGIDSMAYNMQSLEFTQKRDQRIRAGDCSDDPNLEYRPQTFTLLHIPLCPNEGTQ